MIESTKALGEVLVVNLCTSKHWTFEARLAWLVNFVEVYDVQTKEKKEFPCYCWVEDGDGIYLTEKTGAYCIELILNAQHYLQTAAFCNESKINV